MTYPQSIAQQFAEQYMKKELGFPVTWHKVPTFPYLITINVFNTDTRQFICTIEFEDDYRDIYDPELVHKLCHVIKTQYPEHLI